MKCLCAWYQYVLRGWYTSGPLALICVICLRLLKQSISISLDMCCSCLFCLCADHSKAHDALRLALACMQSPFGLFLSFSLSLYFGDILSLSVPNIIYCKHTQSALMDLMQVPRINCRKRRNSVYIYIY